MIRTPLTEAVYQDDDTRQRREALVPMGRIGQAEDIAAAVAYLSARALLTSTASAWWSTAAYPITCSL